MKVIFIPVSDRPECALALHHGFVLGQLTKSSVVGCHIRAHTSSSISLPEETTDSIIAVDSYDLAWEAALKESNQGEDPIKACNLFNNMAQQFNYKLSKKPKSKPCAIWTEKVGSPERLFSIMGPVSDLILISRPIKEGRSLAKTFMLTAIMNSSSPVLVLPQSQITTLGKRICIAWNQSTEAALAVKAAMPLLRQADEVNIITNGPEDRPGPKSAHLKQYLRHWGVKSNHVFTNGLNDTQAILTGYNQTESDLLVMGGYSRSRLRQRVFGGVTEHMLNEANIPIFILHS
ncbi:MAG: universal stress protein [Marinicella sp.]